MKFLNSMLCYHLFPFYRQYYVRIGNRYEKGHYLFGRLITITPRTVSEKEMGDFLNNV